MLIPTDWKDYELIDTGDGEKLERWGGYTLIRPDPQAIWPADKNSGPWTKWDGYYHRSKQGGGQWEFKKKLPENMEINYEQLKFRIKPTDFKHMGLFPEQAVNWRWFSEKIRKAGRPVKVLNLFAYTGGATLAAAQARAKVCHVDAAKGMNLWAKQNAGLSGLDESSFRFITDDVMKFVHREKRRESRYDAIIMDPPSYGRGPKGEMWKLEKNLYSLVELCRDILTPDPLFFLLNLYTTGLSPVVAENILNILLTKRYQGKAYSDELGLKATSSGFILPCGVVGRWEKEPQ